MKELKYLMFYNIKNEEFESCMHIAKSIVLNMDIESSLSVKCHITKTRQFEKNDFVLLLLMMMMKLKTQLPLDSFRNLFCDLLITSVKSNLTN